MIPFKKMHGCGNDFVIIDARAVDISLSDAQVKALADRRLGVGCDQLVIIGASEKAAAFMHIYNADGSKVPTCGNATRCVADILLREKNAKEITVETLTGALHAWREGEDQVRVNMGAPKLSWQEIPLLESRNTLHLGLQSGALMDPVAVNMGNPHAVFFVQNLDMIRMSDAAKLEHHPLFPSAANISAVQVINEHHLRMKVWERGVGETLACGSAACAAVVAGVQRGVCARTAQVDLPGGSLHIDWQPGGEVMMTGPVAYVFEGEVRLQVTGCS
jgi:diaminopimelate epimerase